MSMCVCGLRCIGCLGWGVNQGVFILVPRLAARWPSSDPRTCQHIHSFGCRHQTHHTASSWNTGIYWVFAVSEVMYRKCIQGFVISALTLVSVNFDEEYVKYILLLHLTISDYWIAIINEYQSHYTVAFREVASVVTGLAFSLSFSFSVFAFALAI